jgi:hypothetical protein
MSLKKFILFEFTPRAAMGCLDDIRDSFDVFEEAVTAADQPSIKARTVVDRDTWTVVVSRRAEPPIELLPPVTREDNTAKWLWKMDYLKKRGLPAADSDCWDMAERKWQQAPRGAPPP